MASSIILRHITSASFQLLKTNFRSIQSCNICTPSLLKGWFTRKKKVPAGPTILKADDWPARPVPILKPSCKSGIVIGGGGSGFEAAHHLLSKGALGVVILDDNLSAGQAAAKKLCDNYGRERAHFVCCNAQDTCQFEAAFNFAFCTYKKIHIIFNDLDKKRYPINSTPDDRSKDLDNVAAKVIDIGMRTMSKENGGSGGIIVSCASLLGFIDFPEDPFPIYCMKEAAIETTMHFAKEYDVQKTGVRLVTLCPVNKPFSKIALPCLPNPVSKHKRNERPACIPSPNAKIGTALNYVMAWAKNGSTWVVEPATCSKENPREIFFPKKEGEKVDPKVYNIEHRISPVSLKKSSMVKHKRPTCEATAEKKK